MKTKLFALLGLMVLAFSASANAAGKPTIQSGRAEKYSVSNSTISVSSDTVVTISGFNGYQDFVLDASQLPNGATIFYTIDGSSGATTVRNIGQVVLPGANASGGYGFKERLEASGTINLTLAAGQTAKNLRVQRVRLAQ